jgi:hypothetical protein
MTHEERVARVAALEQTVRELSDARHEHARGNRWLLVVVLGTLAAIAWKVAT